MVYAYHVIWGAYEFWLPNDPRGSWSEFVGAWELFRFGGTTRHLNHTPMITAEERRQREEFKAALKEGKPRQHGSFVKPFPGLEEGGLITYLP